MGNIFRVRNHFSCKTAMFDFVHKSQARTPKESESVIFFLINGIFFTHKQKDCGGQNLK